MSSDRRHESRSSRSEAPNDRSLPPIREVFRDELDQPARPNPYSFGDVQRALPVTAPSSHHTSWAYHGHSERSDQRRSVTLPPIQQSLHSSRGSAHPESSSSQRSYSSRDHPSPQSQPPHRSRSGKDHTYGTEDAGYSYGVLRTSGTSGTLVHATPPASQPHGILRQRSTPGGEEQEDPNKRYKCDYCGKRFGMPSHLQIHIRTHTAQRPFACEWPGCDRTFSVRSNMMRHYRSHGKLDGSSSQYKPEYKDDSGDEQDNNPSSQYFHTSSSGHQSASQYYTSSRRK